MLIIGSQTELVLGAEQCSYCIVAVVDCLERDRVQYFQNLKLLLKG